MQFNINSRKAAKHKYTYAVKGSELPKTIKGTCSYEGLLYTDQNPTANLHMPIYT